MDKKQQIKDDMNRAGLSHRVIALIEDLATHIAKEMHPHHEDVVPTTPAVSETKTEEETDADQQTAH